MKCSQGTVRHLNAGERAGSSFLPLGVGFLRVQTPGCVTLCFVRLLTRPVAYAMQLPPEGEAQSKVKSFGCATRLHIGGDAREGYPQK